MRLQYRYYDQDDPPAFVREFRPEGWPAALTGEVRGAEIEEDLPEPWASERPLCAEVDPEIFFPQIGDGVTAAYARRICGLCPIIAECREWSLEERYGIWGGMSETERRVERRRRRRAERQTRGDGRRRLWQRI